MYRCGSVCVCVQLERGQPTPPSDMHQWANNLRACLPSLNELSMLCKKGSSFLASIFNKMNCYARLASLSVFSLSFPIKALTFTSRRQRTGLTHCTFWCNNNSQNHHLKLFFLPVLSCFFILRPWMN